MVTRAALVVVLLAAAIAPARGDSPKLADARRAVEAVDYDTARRLLLEALRDGDNSPAALGEIYRLSARAAVVLGERDVAEQYYRRWLAIDPAAALPADTAPKLREPFVAAQAYIAAHGRLLARAGRAATGEVDVELVSDPLAMARAASALDAGEPTPVAFGSDHRARLPAGTRVAILDEAGNHLLDLAIAPSEPASRPAAATPGLDERSWTRRWTTWAIPTGAVGLVGLGFGVAALASYDSARMTTDKSGAHSLSEAQDSVRHARTFAWIAAGAGALAAALAIPTAIYFFDERGQRGAALVPAAGDGHAGLAVVGRF